MDGNSPCYLALGIHPVTWSPIICILRQSSSESSLNRTFSSLYFKSQFLKSVIQNGGKGGLRYGYIELL